MRVTNMVPDAQYQMQQTQQALSTALQQVSTGLRVNQLSDDPSASANMVSSLAESANVDQYTKNVSSVMSQMQTADSALSNVVTALNSAVTYGTSGANGTLTAANRQGIATQVQGILTSVIAQANTSTQGLYVFGGSSSSTPPFVQASTTYSSAAGSVLTPLAMSTPLTANSLTTIRDATTGQTFSFKAPAGATVGSLTAAINNAVSAGTLSAGTSATINSAGNLEIGSGGSSGIVVSTSDAALGSMAATAGTEVVNSYAYVGNSGINSVQVGDSLSIQTNVPGNQLFTSGANVIGSLKGLIAALETGTSAQIGTATAAVTAALNYVGQQRIPLDNSISQATAQESYLGQETISLTTRQTSLVGISLSDAATNLSQAELANSAVLAAAAKVVPMTLLDYLK
jgi:flagellin-like hook-associated protein FlgL